MSKIKDTDFMAQFPPALKKDKSMLALGQLIAEELHITANETKKNIIYANIEGLSETWLDVLAYDLHVDWYDYDYPVEIKRKIIKNSIMVHQRLGTKYAMQSVLQDVYRTAKIEEWFEYGGQPYTFKITVSIGSEGLNEETRRELVHKMQFYKNLRSHCEGIYYVLSVERASVKEAAFHKLGAGLKVKPLLESGARAAGQGGVRAAAFLGGTLKVKPLLGSGVKAGMGKAVTARLRGLNRIKVKCLAVDSLGAGMAALWSTKAHCRGRLTMNVRKGQEDGRGILYGCDRFGHKENA